jgi:transcriptional regulator with XRE-family HTH domain
MPKQIIHDASVPSFVLEKLQLWARAIRIQRVAQGLTADALGTRIGISRSTMRRLELGEPAIAAHVYLSAMLVVGLLDTACPSLPEHLQRAALPTLESQFAKIRVRKPIPAPDDF